MRRSLSIRTNVGVFSVLFAAGMWMSKIAQPLHYENAGALVAFGVGYAVMALVGGLSFAWGLLVDRIGGLNAVRLGALLYALGIAGRVFTDLAPTIASSAVAGAGASLALVGLRPWIRTAVSDDLIPRVVATRTLGSQIGVFIGTLGAAALFFAWGDDGSGTVVALVLAAVLALGAFAWACVIPSGTRAVSRQNNSLAESPPARIASIAVKLAVVGALSGFYVSVITPYLPLYLTNAGLSDAASAVVVALMSVVQMCVTAMLTRRPTSPRPIRIFLAMEAASGAATFGVALALGLAPVAVVLLFLARAAFVAVAVTAEETIQYAVIPGSAAGFVFGISQSAFLIGDALGGALGGPIWAAMGPAALATVAGAATIVNAVALPLLFGARRGVTDNESIDVAA